MLRITVSNFIKCLTEVIIHSAVNYSKRYAIAYQNLEFKKSVCNGTITLFANYFNGPIDRLLVLDDNSRNRTYYFRLLGSACSAALEKGNVSTVVSEKCNDLIINFRQVAQNITILPDADPSIPWFTDETTPSISATTVMSSEDTVIGSQLLTFVGSTECFVIAALGTVLLGVSVVYCRYANRVEKQSSLKYLSKENGLSVKWHALDDPLKGNHVVFQNSTIPWD